MGQYVAATVYAWIALAAAWFILPHGLRGGMEFRVLSVWALAAGLLFLVNVPMVILIVVGAALLVIAPSRPAERAAFFLATVGCLPSALAAEVPFPGINYLITLTHYKIAVLLLLVPILFKAWSSPDRFNHSSTAVVCLLAYAVYMSIITGNAMNSTSGLRALLDQVITLVLPFMIIRLAIRDMDDIDACLKGFLLGSILLASVGVVAGLKGWDFYFLFQPATIFTIPDTGPGYVRINATANTHSLAMHLAAALIVLQYLKDRIGIGRIQVNLLRLLFLVGIVYTNSRGAMAALVVAAVVYAVIAIENRRLRTALLASAIAAVIAVSALLATVEFREERATVTLVYRQELLAASIPYILKHPFFGDFAFQSRTEFRHLIQGQGIVDVTNFYLQIALPFGLVGMTLLFAGLVLPLWDLSRRRLSSLDLGAAAGGSTPGRPRLKGPTSPAGMSGGRLVAYPLEYCRISATTVPLLLVSVLLMPLFYVAAAVIDRSRQNLPRVSHSQGPAGQAPRWLEVAGLVISILCGWLFYVTTTSSIALTLHIGLVMAAMGQALCDMTRPGNASAGADMLGGGFSRRTGP